MLLFYILNYKLKFNFKSMLSYLELKPGVIFLLDGQPYQVLESKQQRYAQAKATIETRIRNLITGNVLTKVFHQGDKFEEAEIEKQQIKYLYNYKGEYWFCDSTNPALRFKLEEKYLGNQIKFLTPNLIVEAYKFRGNVININLPIKLDLKVVETSPNFKGDTAQGGTKSAILESGAKVTVPLFIEVGDIIRVNTQTGEYIERVREVKDHKK